MSIREASLVRNDVGGRPFTGIGDIQLLCLGPQIVVQELEAGEPGHLFV